MRRRPPRSTRTDTLLPYTTLFRSRLLIDGDRIPILREKDILTPDTADTPAKLVYLAVQLMYLSPDPMAHHPTYFSLVRDILNRSEEHTSELQSLMRISYAVFCLKKKNKQIITQSH